MIKLKEIREHELLDSEQRKVCEALVKHAKGGKSPFGWLQFAEVVLKGTARNYVEHLDSDEEETSSGRRTQARIDLELRRAAVLYVYEALRACDLGIIKEWPEFDEMLKNLVYLAGDLP